MKTKLIIIIFSIIIACIIGWLIFLEYRYAQDPYETSFKKFQVMTGKDLHMSWHETFHDWIYVLDPRMQFKEINCSLAVIKIFKDLGANIDYKNEKGTYMNVDEIHNLLKFHSYKFRRISQIKGKEVIVFKRDGKNIPHIAFIEMVRNGKILIMEMNARYGGVNYRWLKWNDWRIEGIYPVTLGFWRGG